MNKKWIAMFFVTALVLSVSMGSTVTVGQAAEKLRFYVCAHGGISDPFWQRVGKGVEDAAKELGPNVEATFLAPQVFSVEKLVDLVEGAIATKPDGIAVTITRPEALNDPLRRAIKMGIPVIGIDMEDPRPDRIPYLTFVGWNNYDIGVLSANKVLDELKFTPHHVLIAIHQAGHTGLEQRSQGLMDVFKERVPEVKIDKVHTTVNMAKAVSVYEAFLKANPDVDMIFATGCPGGDPAIKFLEESGLAGKILFVTADLSPISIDAIKSGTCAFTTDCQQYLWGWLPVMLLYKYSQFEIMPPYPIYTGPTVVDKSNVGEVEAYVKKGVR